MAALNRLIGNNKGHAAAIAAHLALLPAWLVFAFWLTGGERTTNNILFALSFFSLGLLSLGFTVSGLRARVRRQRGGSTSTAREVLVGTPNSGPVRSASEMSDPTHRLES